MQTIFNPREARQFAALLEDRAAEIRSLNSKVARTVQELGASGWQDAKYRQFVKRYDETSTLLQRFAERAGKYAGYLRDKAAPVERYLGDSY